MFYLFDFFFYELFTLYLDFKLTLEKELVFLVLFLSFKFKKFISLFFNMFEEGELNLFMSYFYLFGKQVDDYKQ